MTRHATRKLILTGAGMLLLGPVVLLGAVYIRCFQTNLPGARHGPGDAHRHVLASALVSYTLSPRCVAWVTGWMEHGEGESHAMDAHNNRIGARIGAEATGWKDLDRRVLAAVGQGSIRAESPKQVTWLPERAWGEKPY